MRLREKAVVLLCIGLAPVAIGIAMAVMLNTMEVVTCVLRGADHFMCK